MKDEIISNMTDKEKILLFDLAFDTSKKDNISFEKAMDSVIQAFIISKSNDMDMSPNASFTSSDPFEMDMSPSPNITRNDPFNLNMNPKPDDFKSSSDTFNDPTIEPINPPKTDYDNNVTI